MSFALFFPEGSSIMGKSSNIGVSSNVSKALKGGREVSTPLSKLMTSITNLYEVIDQIVSFCRGRLELSSGKNIFLNT
jgi:hypothetical protein